MWAELPWSELDDKAVIPAVQQRQKLGRPGDVCPALMYETMLGCWRLGQSCSAMVCLCQCAQILAHV